MICKKNLILISDDYLFFITLANSSADVLLHRWNVWVYADFMRQLYSRGVTCALLVAALATVVRAQTLEQQAQIKTPTPDVQGTLKALGTGAKRGVPIPANSAQWANWAPWALELPISSRRPTVLRDNSRHLVPSANNKVA